MAWQATLRIATGHCNRIINGPPLTDDELLQVADWVDTATADLALDLALTAQRIEISGEEWGADLIALGISIAAWLFFALDRIMHEELTEFGWVGFGVAILGVCLAVWIYDRHRKSMFAAQDDLDDISYTRDKVSELKQRLIPLYAGTP